MTEEHVLAGAGEPFDPASNDVDGALPVSDIAAGDGSSADAGYEQAVPSDAAVPPDGATSFVAARPAEAPQRVNDAMRVLSRMQVDLDLVTEGKRAASYGEVDKAFNDAVTALGIKLPASAGGEGPSVSGAAPSALAGAEVSPDRPSGDAAAPQDSYFGRAGMPLVGTDPGVGAQAAPNISSAGAAADGFSPQVPESPGLTGANPASPVQPKTRSKGANAAAPAATLWPKLADQRTVTLARDWPIPGDHHFAVNGAKGTNGLLFSDGRYAPEGGYRGTDSRTKKPRKHKGIDIPATTGDPVGAAADGVVLQSSRQKDWGNFVAIRHPDGYVTLYAHLDTRTKLKAGQAVTRGTEIGKVGNSGNAKSKGTHLHFEVRVYNGDSTLAAGSRTVDPDAWIRGALHEP